MKSARQVITRDKLRERMRRRYNAAILATAAAEAALQRAKQREREIFDQINSSAVTIAGGTQIARIRHIFREFPAVEWSPQAIMLFADANEETTRAALKRMRASGEVQRLGYGRWIASLPAN